jgi:hypothetical protein
MYQIKLSWLLFTKLTITTLKSLFCLVCGIVNAQFYFACICYRKNAPRILKINEGIRIAPNQPFQAALSAESRVGYPGNTADRQPQWVLTYCYLSQSTANQNEKLIYCHDWDSNLRPSARKRTSLTTLPSHPHNIRCACAFFFVHCPLTHSRLHSQAVHSHPLEAPHRHLEEARSQEVEAHSRGLHSRAAHSPFQVEGPICHTCTLRVEHHIQVDGS